MARERRNAETKIFSLPGGQEVLCIYCWPAMEGDQVHYTVTYPSRRVDPASPEALREYAAVWAEAAAWLAGAAEQSEATLDGPNPFEAGIQEAREQVKSMLKSAYKFDDPAGFLEEMVEWSGFTGGAR